MLCYTKEKGGSMEQVKANVEEWQRTKSIHLAATTMELLAKIFEEEEE